MNLVNSLPINENENALDHIPVPYAVVASAGDGTPVVENWKAGMAFVKLDVDELKTHWKREERSRHSSQSGNRTDADSTSNNGN